MTESSHLHGQHNNCLFAFRLCEGKTVKVTDIGLTQELFSKDYYFTEEHTAKLPVKWMAPESLENFVFSIQSDVVSKINFFSFAKSQFTIYNRV